MLTQFYDAKMVYQNQIPNTFKNIAKCLLMQSSLERKKSKNLKPDN